MFVSKWLRRVSRCAMPLFATAAAALPIAPMAQNIAPLQVRNDPGGSLVARLREIHDLRMAGRPVEIRSGFCNSACTLYLSLPTTCVTRETSFGFHGPSSSVPGLGLSAEEFEYWSKLMADHYPAMIRTWFLQEGRNITHGIYKVSGAQVIRAGVRECA